MKLFVSETKVQDAVIPIRWCLNRKELEELKEYKAKNPHLLLVIVRNKREVDRYLIPLDQMLAYIQFHKPGENRILATVVWHCHGNTHDLRRYFLKPYGLKIMDYDGENLCRSFDWPYRQLQSQTQITIMVPAEMFAKEPPTWEKWWVNRWFETKPRDQCQYRRRRMIAYTIQPPLVLLFVIGISIFRALAASVLLFLGKRRVNLKPIIHPFQCQSNDVWWDLGSSVFLRNAKGKRQPWLITLFSPLSFLGFLAVVVGIRFIFPSLISSFVLQWWCYPLGALAIMAGIAAIVSLFLACFFFVYFLLRIILKTLKASVPKSWSEQRKVRQEQALKKAQKRRWEEAETKYRKEEQLRAELEQLLACDGDFVPRLSALPKKKQTIYLRFQDLKAKVCKPFAR